MTAEHDLENVFGEGSPLSRLHDPDGCFVLIGEDNSKNTSFHLAECRADYEGKHDEQESSAILIDGVRQWVSYWTLAVEDEDFAMLGETYEAEHGIRRPRIGRAEVGFMRQRPFEDRAVRWMDEHRVPSA